MSRQILFVTFLTEGFQSGFLYSTELARFMEKDIRVLIIGQRDAIDENIENTVTAVAFAEAGEHESVRSYGGENPGYEYAAEIAYLKDTCHELDINLSISYSEQDIVNAIRRFVKQNHGVDLILLGTTVTENGHIRAKELKRLIRSSARPIVTIGNDACVA
jgi:hypothetical protein